MNDHESPATPTEDAAPEGATDGASEPARPDVPKGVAEALESLERLIRRYGTLTEEQGLVAAREILKDTGVEPSLDVVYAFTKPLEEKPSRAPRGGRKRRGRRGPGGGDAGEKADEGAEKAPEGETAPAPEGGGTPAEPAPSGGEDETRSE